MRDLLAERPYTTAELAAAFGVSDRQVRYDLLRLQTTHPRLALLCRTRVEWWEWREKL
ncbi:MAG: FaeA/PapI family transcriptional regulator [Anaerovoracaceae bacterium]|jgi:predicted DNA-binding transcriptional regulator YafY